MNKIKNAILYTYLGTLIGVEYSLYGLAWLCGVLDKLINYDYCGRLNAYFATV